jgi:hypothetical protein
MPAMRDWTGVVSGDYRLEAPDSRRRTPCGHVKWTARCNKCGARIIGRPKDLMVPPRKCRCRKGQQKNGQNHRVAG